jgi:NADH:ubiquinone reductase (H+-translocating)
MPGRSKVVILGGGFGGVGAAKKLKDADADVLLVDQHDYHTFQPLLYQVATDLVETSTVGHPLRDLFHDHPNISVHEATVNGIDLENRTVSFEEMEPERYDQLVLALGATVNFFGVAGATEHAFPLYTLPDAVRLRKHVIKLWEAADRDPSLIEDGALNVVVVGAGATGVESAGALAELYRTNLSEDFPKVPQDKARLILVEAGDAVLPMFKKSLQAYAKKALEKRTVEISLGEIVEKIEQTRVHLKSGTVLNAHTLVWGAGLQASPLAAGLGLELQHGGRIPTEPDLSVAGHPEVFVAGDIGWITDTKTKKVLPQLGSVALQAGERAGENIARRLEGKQTEPFKYLDKGTMATIGRKAAVVQMPHGRSMKGATAWLAWGAVHLALLSTGEAKARAVLDWTWAGFTHERAGRIVVDGTDE